MSKRERIFRATGGAQNPAHAKEFLEVRESDPDDLDALLKEIDTPIKGNEWPHEKLDKIRAAREGGE